MFQEESRRQTSLSQIPPLSGHSTRPCPLDVRVLDPDYDGDLVVRVSGELDMATAGVLRDAIEKARRGHRRLVLDLAATTFIDSSGLAVILDARRTAGVHALVVRSPQPCVLRVFEVSGIAQLITVEA